MILYPSPYSQDDMLNYKSLESFKQFQNGWVREVLVKISVEKRLIIGKVNSYTLVSLKLQITSMLRVCLSCRWTTLNGWMRSHKSHGSLLKERERYLLHSVTAWQGWGRHALMLHHCFGPMLLEWKNNQDSLIVTQKNAYWVMPLAIKSVPYTPDIKFIGKKRKSSMYVL